MPTNSVNFDPDELMYYLKLAAKKFDEVYFAYPTDMLNGRSISPQPHVNRIDRPLCSPEFPTDAERRQCKKRRCLSLDSVGARKDHHAEEMINSETSSSIGIPNKIEELVGYLMEEFDVHDEITQNMDALSSVRYLL